MNNEKKIICCLVVSDIHDCSSILKLIPLEKEVKFDYCFALGDYLSLTPEQINKEEYIIKGEAFIKEVISILESLSNEVIYLAGNHDPSSFFANKSIKLTEHSHYLHKQVYQIDEDLLIAGIGGSIVSVLDGTNEKEWEGYPYNQTTYTESDTAYGQDLTKTINIIKAEDNLKKKKIVLLTHNGPKNPITAQSTHDGTIVQSGSKELKTIIDNNSNIILNIHGHTHSGLGDLKINSNTIVSNPGSTRDKNYSIINLSKIAQGEWGISISHKVIEEHKE